MPVEPAFWCSLRKDFETLKDCEFGLICHLRPPLSPEGKPLCQWLWLRFPHESLKARLSAMALKGARALGYNSDAAWYESIRRYKFGFEVTGRSGRSDGFGNVTLDSEDGGISNVVEASITLCYWLEMHADSVAVPAVGFPLSHRDVKIHEVIGEKRFRTLTNAEIMNEAPVARVLRRGFALEKGDKAKSCFDRIRLAKGYPKSREVTKERSKQK